LLPGTDFIPSFTIMWFMQNMNRSRDKLNVSRGERGEKSIV
jgi:hypothetical protein